MDLEKLKLETERYNKIITDIDTLIDDYVNTYKKYETLYFNKKYKWVSSLISEFKKIFKSLDFEVKEDTKIYGDNITGKTKHIYHIASFQSLEFELSIDAEINSSYDKDRYNGIRFLKNKPEVSKINKKITPSVSEYNIKIDFNNRRDGILIKDFTMGSISKMEDIKRYIEETNFTLESMEESYQIIAEEKKALDDKINEIENNDFMILVEINKEELEVESLGKVIELL